MKYELLPNRYWIQQENGKWSSIARSNIDATEKRLEPSARQRREAVTETAELADFETKTRI